MIGRRMSVAEAMAEAIRDRAFFDESGGGVTVSGGEPLAQPAFLKALLTACRHEGIHTAVDTCGFAPLGDLLAVAPLADLFLYDLKAMDSDRHRAHTGVPNERILSNLRALGPAHRNVWLRIPVVPGVNDEPEEMEAAARFAASIPGVRQVNLLPYHATGRHKTDRRIGPAHRTAARASGSSFEAGVEPGGAAPAYLRPPGSEELTRLARCFSAAGLEVKIGG
jgi:pyruvate formate lyase activating enzyme